MLKKEIMDILAASKDDGWVVEPEAKRLLSLANLDVPKFKWVKEPAEAVRFAEAIGYPVAAKIVSPRVIHKSDVGGVVIHIETDDRLKETFHRFSRVDGFAGMLVEEMIKGLELFAGIKMDHQFGPVVLLGIGGTAVEIYRDTTLRMAPIQPRDVKSMVRGLKAHRLLEGYRGAEPIHLGKLTRLLIAFSDLAMALEGRIESMDLNPLICSSSRCVVADARIMLMNE